MQCRAVTTCRGATAVLALVVGARCPADVVYVNGAAPEGGDGASWKTAYDDLAVGLASAAPGDEVWVAAGTYVPSGGRDASFVLPSAAPVLGGFAGDEENRAERDWVVHETVLSGDRNGDDGPDFENYEDNSFHVVDGSGAVDAELDGFTIRGGHANGVLDEARRGAGLYARVVDLTVRHCVFRLNLCETTGAGLLGDASGALRVEDCRFVENRSSVGGGLSTRGVESVSVTGSRFARNVAAATGGGGFCGEGSSVVFTNCVFEDNLGGAGGGGAGGGLTVWFGVGTVITDCVFVENTGGVQGGGMSIDEGLVANCVFSRNEAAHGAGLGVVWSLTVVNSTFGQNLNGAIQAESTASVVVANSVLWGNGPESFHGSGSISVSHSDVEGGWPGEGNIDADPLFVQPGAGNLRLAFGSPCVDAGDNDALPPGLDLDLDGEPRIQNGVVDMGAYEGEHEPLPPRAEDDDIDDGEGVLLVPNGGGFDPERNTLAIFNNRSGEDGASASLTEHRDDRHPGARGFSSLGTTAVLETSIGAGGFLAQVFIPFGEEDVEGVDPLAVDLTYFDEGVGNWALAVSRNTAPSPGHPGVIGDRIAREGPGPWGLTSSLGDYGVFFNTETRRGFAWANVDHAADFSQGLPVCPADVEQPPNSRVDFADLLAVLANWGAGPGPFDINDDGIVDAEDLMRVLSEWGGCE